MSDRPGMKIAPYGTWKSPISPEDAYKSSTSIQELYVDSSNKEIYQLELHPSEGGRQTLLPSLPHSPKLKPLIPSTSDLTTKVHEYGGASVAVDNRWVVWSENGQDGEDEKAGRGKGRVWRSKVDGSGREVLTPDTNIYRYADFHIHPHSPSLILAIREDHTYPAPADVVNTVVLIDADAKDVEKAVKVVVEGDDFYAFPRWDEKGERVCWVQWSHPDMPWEGSRLFYADFDSKKKELSPPVYIAGKKKEISVGQPSWSANKIYFLCDETGFTNLWVADIPKAGAKAEGGKAKVSAGLAMKQVEYDLGSPAWQLGMSQYVILNPTTALIAPVIKSNHLLSVLNLKTGKYTPLKGAEDFPDLGAIRRLSDVQAVFIGTSGKMSKKVVIVTLSSHAGDATFKVLGEEDYTLNPSALNKSNLDPAYISESEVITLKVPWNEKAKRPRGMGEDVKEVDVHVRLYLPKNPGYRAEEEDEKRGPPCLVGVHGGPTSATSPAYNVFTQYFTTRGFAYLDVDYGGSATFGRQYIERLASNWGIVDVHDTVQCVAALGKFGKIDASKVAIRGGSAGGYTTLAALTDSKVFTAGVSLYGVADVKLLASDTHKFESRYMGKLMGGTPDEVPQVYHDRSPLYKAENITADLILFQGEDDKVVPPGQAREMIKRIEATGGKVESIFYPGEGHGFRKIENLKDSLIRTENFLRKAFKLQA